MRSLFSGVAGLKGHQTRMDVIGNNIANVNTTGFKSSRVTFADTLNQTVSGASAPGDTIGGTNPQQIGLGVGVGVRGTGGVGVGLGVFVGFRVGVGVGAGVAVGRPYSARSSVCRNSSMSA